MAEKGSFNESLIATYVITAPPQALVLFLYADFANIIAFPVYVITVLIVMTPLNLVVAGLNTKFLKSFPSSHPYTLLLGFYSLFTAFFAIRLYKLLSLSL